MNSHKKTLHKRFREIRSFVLAALRESKALFITCDYCIPVAAEKIAPWQLSLCINARVITHAMSGSFCMKDELQLMRSTVKWLMLAWTMCAFYTPCRAGNILVLPTPLAQSHLMGMQAMASELSQRTGHQVMVSLS